MAGVAYGLIGLSCALTVLVFVMVYADTRKLFAPDDPAGRATAGRVVLWAIICWPVGLYLLVRLRREARMRETGGPAE